MSTVSAPVRFLRVLIEPSGTKKGVWVAHCLETGYVATGNSDAGARDQMLGILREEVSYARKHNNMGAIFRKSPIPQDLLDRWETAIREHPPKEVALFPGTDVELASLPWAA